MKVAPGVWHTLRVDFQGRRFRIAFDGHPALEWDDDTFAGPGAVGVWTKADSHTLFDDFVAAAATQAGGEDPAPLELIGTIPLPGVVGRFDHFACDLDHSRLFVAALGNNSLERIALDRLERLPSITGLRKPTGVLFSAGTGCVQVANGDDGTVRAYDAGSGALTVRIEGLDDADNMRFDAVARQVYVGYGSGALGILDAALTRLVAGIPLPGHPESFQLEERGARIFVNVPDAGEIAVIDRAQRRVAAHWPVGKFGGNFPMALDEDAHRLFVGCRNPPRLVVLDTTTGRMVADLAISGDTDDLFYDSRRHQVYASCGEGFLDTIHCREDGHYERIARQPTRDGARTSYFDATLDRLFLAVPKRGSLTAEIRVFRPR